MLIFKRKVMDPNGRVHDAEVEIYRGEDHDFQPIDGEIELEDLDLRNTK